MNNSQVGHAFSGNPFGEGKSSNIFFENGKIYSYGYHFCIAKVMSDTYPRVALVSDRGYSSSTAKHQSIVISAISHWDLIYVDDADADWQENMKFFAQVLEHQIGRVTNSKTDLKKEKAAEALEETNNNLTRYLAVLDSMKIKVTVRSQKQLEYKEIVRKILKLRKLIAGGEEEMSTLGKHLAVIKRKKKRDQNIQEKKNYQKDLEIIANWRTGGRRFIYDNGINLQTYFEQELGMNKIDKTNWELRPNALLRISENGENIETSKEYELAIQKARIVYDMLKRGKALGLEVDSWKISTVTDDVVIIGCHTIPRCEIEVIAEKLGWI